MKSFLDLQSDLGPVLILNRPDSGVEHVLVALPSYSIGESLLSHYASRIPALEHRYLVACLMLQRIPAVEMVFISSETPGQEVLDYYNSLLPAQRQADARRRLRLLTVPDRSSRSVAAKLLDQPELLARLRRSFAGRPAFIEPWNVTQAEVEVATRLQAPINGTRPDLWHLGFKSAGRRLFAAAAVPTPPGREGVRSVDDVVSAAEDLRREHPSATALIVKHDDSGAGDGNVLLDLRSPDGRPLESRALRAVIQGWPEWYLRDLASGGVVEERVTGHRFSSPSVQADVLPDGEVIVLATHEQVLGGDSGQVYMGCRFPADPAYGAELARYGRAVGKKLAELGVTGRFSVDFAVTVDAHGRPSVFALEINLRKGGTTHPYCVLRSLVPGRYDAEGCRWVAHDGTSRAYAATDNLVDSAWVGLPPATVINAVKDHGLKFDHRTGTGVVLHMLSCLAIDGRFGVTCIGRTPAHADELLEATSAAVGTCV